MRRMSDRPGSAANRSWHGWLKFLAVGLGGYVVLTGAVMALVEWVGLGERLSFAIVITLVMFGNFYANRRFVYPQSHQRDAVSQAIRFFTVAVFFRVLEFFTYSWLIGPLGINYVIALTATCSLGYLIKYYAFSIWVFR